MTAPVPPQAAKRPFEHSEHGVARPDPYAWLRDVDSHDVLAHLASERAFYDSSVGHLASLVEELQSEMVGRTPETESSVSCPRRHFSYYTRLPAGREHPQLLRDLNTFDGSYPPDPQGNTDPAHDFGSGSSLLLDANELGDGSEYVDLGLTAVSPDERLLAYSVDLVGEEVYQLRFRDLDTGSDLDDVVPRSYFGGAWAAASDWFFYTVHDESYRPYQVWRHRIGSPASEDVLLLEEPDERFDLGVRQARSGRVAVLSASSSDTDEVWVVDLTDPTGPARSVGGRRPGVRYHAEHVVLPDGSSSLLVVTDDGAPEFRLVHAPMPGSTGYDASTWQGLLPGRDDERLERVDAFAGFVVLTLRTAGERRLRVIPMTELFRWLGSESVETAGSYDIRPMFPAGTVKLGPNPTYDVSAVIVADGSYIHPWVWSDVDLRTGERTERHRQEAPGHDPGRYVCERYEFPAPDGVPVPAALVRHVNTLLDGTAPALLYGYGAYEAVDEPQWTAELPSLLDRGVVFVHAHIRGGGEGGRHWYLDGRLDHKQNTFSDHAAVADGLVADALVDGTRVATRGLSAGGLLQGAVFSQRPDCWRAVVAEVPFVDVVTTMFDATIPLTPQEWTEWGDPRREADFGWLLAYSPYDNPPPAGARPDLLVTGALHDPRVMVWEPAKWVARLRETDPEWAPRCLFRVEMGAGAHTGPSGRFAHLRYEAEVYAWLLDRLADDGG